MDILGGFGHLIGGIGRMGGVEAGGGAAEEAEGGFGNIMNAIGHFIQQIVPLFA